VGKQGVKKNYHAIIYTGEEPNERRREMPAQGERGMLQSIKVRPQSKQDKLDSLSRINFEKVYTVEHNLKVYDFGEVAGRHHDRLWHQWRQVCDQKRSDYINAHSRSEKEGDGDSGRSEDED
jgi:hypothetical protein